MNPSVGGWNNPPPPGTEVAQEDEDEHSSTSSMTKSTPGEDVPLKLRSIDRIDPYLKNPEYVEYEKQVHSRDRPRHHRRSRSRSKHSEKERKSKDSDRKHRSHSRSHDRYRRSRSRGRRHHRYRSNSRSSSPNKNKHGHGKSKKEKRHKRSSSRTRRYSRSYSRSRSRSRSRRGHRRSRAHRSRNQDDPRSGSEEKDEQLNTSGEFEEDEEPTAKENAFKNDGSFLEMFKKMQEEQQKAAEAAKEQAGASEIKKPLPAFGKRRGGRVLKTGLVEKTKIMEEPTHSEGLDAWSVYMKEVKRYKEACCDDDSKTRPLVK